MIRGFKQSNWASCGSPFFLATRALLTLLLAPSLVYAHGDVHPQLLEVSQQIEKDPGNAKLYLRRAELYRVHQDWDAAQSDFAHAQILDPKLDQVDFLRGRLYFEANWPLSAKVALDRFLVRQTNHAEALVIRARVLAQLNHPLQGVRDFSQAIEFSKEPRPELYVERAQLLASGGGPFVAEALQGLDEGIKKLNSSVTLQLCAIEIEAKAGNYARALTRLDSAMAGSPRKENWLVRKGEILEQAGRTTEARDAFKSSLDAIESLPEDRKTSPAVVELRNRINEHLDKPKD